MSPTFIKEETKEYTKSSSTNKCRTNESDLSVEQKSPKRNYPQKVSVLIIKLL